ncbi:hypothetical protein C1646_763495 [Rhizophagus diaphanus]|nr:hypothetical protein C1646_763495 [Rhizophagus diaphanus] [Rhizophagus sp. MUCL 43196]
MSGELSRLEPTFCISVENKNLVYPKVLFTNNSTAMVLGNIKEISKIFFYVIQQIIIERLCKLIYTSHNTYIICKKTNYSTKREKAVNEQETHLKARFTNEATRYRKGVATVVDADHRSRTEARAYDEDYINNNNITLNDVQSIEDLGSYV